MDEYHAAKPGRRGFLALPVLPDPVGAAHGRAPFYSTVQMVMIAPCEKSKIA
jgi:hypothetical protein